MIWVMLFTGILLGWVIEWIIDTYRYNRMVERLQSDHSHAVMDITNRYKTALEEDRLLHEERLNELQAKHHSAAELTKVEFNTRINEHTTAQRQKLKSNQQHFQSELLSLNAKNADELTARDNSYAHAKSVLEQGYNEDITKLKAEYEQRLCETSASLRTQHEEDKEQQIINLREKHNNALNQQEIRIRSEYENELKQVQRNKQNTSQQQIEEHNARLKRDFDYALEQNNAQHRNEIAALKADYEQHIDELTLLAHSQSVAANNNSETIPSLATNSAISHVKADSITIDDLTVIEGIGPKANSVLHNAGINSYNDLAHANVGALKHILQDAGSRFRLLAPDTWPQQASLAAEGNWEALGKLQDSLDGGRPAS